MALLALLLTTSLLVGCSGGDRGDGPVGSPTGRLSSAQARSQEQQILDERATAVRGRDLAGFLRHVDPADKALVSRQRRYFRNLVQLPLERFGYRVLPDQWAGLVRPARWGEVVRIPKVQLTMQLRRYDALAVEQTVGFVFSYRDGVATIVSDRTSGGKPLVEGSLAPWDITAVTVREEPGVLGIFDRSTRAAAPTVMSAVRNGMSDLDRALPFRWEERVVVYHVTNPRVLASFTNVPGGAIAHLGAMTFPQYTSSSRHKVASTRMLLMPSSVRAGQPFLGRIARHELSHVALGTRDDGIPTWLSEGIAEYLGARAVPSAQRIIPTQALARAETEDAGMPASSTFNNSDQEWHYALSWMACDYIARTRGEPRLWELMRALHDGGKGTSDGDADATVRAVLGFGTRELARRAAARIRNIYG